MAILYSTSLDEGRKLAQELSDLLPDGKEPIVTQFGPVLGTYIGPNALGIGLLRGN